MEPFENPEPIRRRFDAGEPRLTSETRRGRKTRERTPQIYKVCDGASEALIYFMVVFTPWAFGTTEEWSIWTMNVTAYLLGGLLITKWIVRWHLGFKPARWGEETNGDDLVKLPPSGTAALTRSLTVVLAALTCFILAYCLVSALNARAVYLPGLRRFEYFDTIKWLPQSYDAASTWQSFWMYLGLAFFFWSLRDWLLGKTSQERHRSPVYSKEGVGLGEDPEMPRLGATQVEMPPWRSPATAHSSYIPARLRRLLWVLCINGAILAVESILQRLSGTNKLLWLLEPRLNITAESQFGPYAYRSNAAQYFNLLWPVCLGFWMLLRRAALRKHRVGARIGEGSHVVLLPAAVLMAACPVISTSRGGALVAMANLMAALAIVLWAIRKESLLMRASVIALFVAIAALSGYLGWHKLAARMKTIFEDQMSRRTEIYENALPIARDFPVFGTGPGTFGSLYQLYRSVPSQSWAAYVHDDWLETRITFGWVGFTAILAMFLTLVARPFGTDGLGLPFEFFALVTLSLGGCLMHAKFDFPFQIYSVVFLFCLFAALQFCLTPQRLAGS
ncbi:MAG: O-antigen ligase family protein [Verrucomicrobiales bacterium]|nr:O-antigen ligase family protein [Verrucomicrobiales bacterium]